MVFKLNYCCCSCTLQLGTLIICSIRMLGAIVSVLCGTTESINAVKMLNRAVDSSEDSPNEHFYPDSTDCNCRNNQFETNYSLHQGAIYIALGVFSIVSNGLAIDTALKSSRPNLLIPWLVEAAINIIPLMFLFVQGLTEPDFGKTFFFIFSTVLSAYSWIVVYSYYIELKQQSANNSSSIDSEKIHSEGKV